MVISVLPPTHVSAETAHTIDGYPYGRKTCFKRYWLETNGNKGVRLVTQTSNPKRNQDWNNAPKASTYSEISGALYIDENGHVQWQGLSSHCDASKARAFLNTFGTNAANYNKLAQFVADKEAIQVEYEKDGKPSHGTPEFCRAFARGLKAAQGKPATPQ